MDMREMKSPARIIHVSAIWVILATVVFFAIVAGGLYSISVLFGK